ncbi:MAG: DUF3194 domain-containing protein [Candidatus Hodarchaeota archaeon]
MQIENENELVEKIYLLIHTFLSKRLGKEMLNDNIDVFVTIDPVLGIDISIEIDLEISPFSNEDAQTLSQEAINHALEKLDSDIRQFCDKVKQSDKQAN